MLVRFKYRIFYNEETGYSVCQYKNVETGETMKIVGTNLPTIKNITYEMDARQQLSGRYAGSYDVISYKESIGKEKEEIINFLSCGLFKGLTKRAAEKIYDALGDDAIEKMDSDISVLDLVPSIAGKTREKIKESWFTNRASGEVAKLLLPYGMTLRSCNKIVKKYKQDSIKTIKNSPYELCSISGINFQMADQIAKDSGSFTDTDYRRIVAASDQVLKDDMVSGSVCMKKLSYANQLIKMLNTPSFNRSNALSYVLRMMKDGSVCYYSKYDAEGKQEYFYHPQTFQTERRVAADLKTLLSEKKRDVADLDQRISSYEQQFGITLDSEQKNAVRLLVREPICLLTGGPGTGKTTILKFVRCINRDLAGKDSTIFLSPTGKAARRMSESTGGVFEAQTIHSALKLYVKDDEDVIGDDRMPDEPLLEDMRVIVDEVSMLDLWVFSSLLKNLRNSTLALCGDCDQLPSVRCGNVLKDLIDSGIVPVARLETIHRQSDDAINICRNAFQIKNGITEPFVQGEDFQVHEANSLELAELIQTRLAIEEIGKLGIDNVKILCPFLKGYSGVYRMNNLIQKSINPIKEDDIHIGIGNEMRIHNGDPVMQLKNTETVANGDTGTVISATKESVSVIFTDAEKTIVDYTHEEARQQLTLAYASTVHKSQGAEFDTVIMSMTDQHRIMKRRPILYTAITRARRKMILIGSDQAFADAIANNSTQGRISNISELLNPKSEHFRKMLERPEVSFTYEQMRLPFCD